MLWSRLTLILAIELTAEILLGRLAIPALRKIKTGKFDIYIGDRFRKDGSEPKLGGAVMAAALITGLIPACTAASFGAERPAYEGAVAAIYALAVFSFGAAEDILKDLRHRNVGIKPAVRNFCVYMLSLGALAALKLICGHGEEILLPFRLGYIDLGIWYYPIGAAVMTLTVSAVKVHDCFAGDTESSADGCCCVTFVIFAAACCICAGILKNAQVQAISCCCCCMALGILFWGLAPAKLYVGESGAMLMGALTAVLPALMDLQFILPLAGIAFLTDGICSAVQYIVYRKTKKLVFRGNSLHDHLLKSKMNEYKVIMLSAAVSAVGAAVAAAFAVYAEKIMIN